MFVLSDVVQTASWNERCYGLALVLWKALYFLRQESQRILSPAYRLVMNLSVLIARRVSPRVHLLSWTTPSYRLIICVLMVACFVLPPQMCSVDDGNEDSAPVIAVVTRINPSSSPREGQEQAGSFNRVRTPRISPDNCVRTVGLNLWAQNGRTRLNALCSLRC